MGVVGVVGVVVLVGWGWGEDCGGGGVWGLSWWGVELYGDRGVECGGGGGVHFFMP